MTDNSRPLRRGEGFNLSKSWEFPLDKPQDRRSIIVLPLNELASLKADKNLKGLTSGDVYYAPSDLAFYERASESTKLFLEELDKLQSFKTHPIFLQDEYDLDKYYNASSISKLADDKWRHYLNVCISLGLARFKVRVIELNESKSNTSAGLGLNLGPFKYLESLATKISLEKTVKKIERQLNSTELWIDKNDQSPNIDQARKYIELHKIKDKDIDDIIYRRGEVSSGTFRFKQTVNLFKQFDSSLDVALNVKVPSTLPQFDMSYKNQISKIEKYQLDLRLIFGAIEGLSDEDKAFLEWKTEET